MQASLRPSGTIREDARRAHASEHPSSDLHVLLLNGSGNALFGVAHAHGPPHDTLAYAIGKRKVATIGKKKDRTDKTHGTTDIKPAKKQYQANDHPQRDQ